MLGAPLSDTIKCSQQAFSKARSGIIHSIFKECFERMLDFLCSRESLDCHARFMGVWGRQIIAIDGSKIPLPNRKARTNLLYTMFVFDRGYASKNLISFIEDTMHARYLFRLRAKFNTDIDAVPAPLEQNGISDSTINQKGNKNKYMTNMNELIGYLSRHFGEYMDADTLTQKFDIIRCIFDFSIFIMSPKFLNLKAKLIL